MISGCGGVVGGVSGLMVPYECLLIEFLPLKTGVGGCIVDVEDRAETLQEVHEAGQNASCDKTLSLG